MTHDQKIAADQTSLQAGQIRFFDNFLPKLVAGPYSITVSQTIEGDELEPPPFVRRQEFIVDAPRFVLSEEEVHSVYPPPNIQAHYQGVLPQVVLRKRNLPWEREVYQQDYSYRAPWIALLLFEADEIILAEHELSAALRTRAVSRFTKELFASEKLPATYLPPQIKPIPETDPESCYTIDLDKNTFLQLAPRLDELPYLTHVREVNTEEKEFLGMHADGWFSIVLGNRLPKTPPPIPAGSQEALEGKNFVRNIAHLVSLEGFTGYLAESPEGVYQQNLDNSSYERVRLASLASWEFYCKPPVESFTKIMDRLGTAMLKVKDTASLENEAVEAALSGGYVPLQYHTRIGEQTLAWYRGPLLPVIQPDDSIEDDTFFSAEAGLIYNQETGIFDASYATAWQIGRLLALSDAHFAESLLSWKRTATRKISEFLERSQLEADHSQMPTDDPFDPKKIKALLSPDFPMNTFFKHFLEQVTMAEKYFNKLRHPDAQIDAELKDFPGIITPKTYEELFQLGKELQQALVDELLSK